MQLNLMLYSVLDIYVTVIYKNFIPKYDSRCICKINNSVFQTKSM